MAHHLKHLKHFLIYLRVLACPVSRVPLGELIHQPNSGFCTGIYSFPIGNFWFITTWFHCTEPHSTEPKWWKVSVGKASHSCVPSGLPLPVLSPGSMDITRQSRPPVNQNAASASLVTHTSEPLVHWLALSFSLEQVIWSKSSLSHSRDRKLNLGVYDSL